jgi:hypothetical protein
MLRQWTRHVLSPSSLSSFHSSAKYPIIRGGTFNTRWLTRSNRSNGSNNGKARVFLRHLTSGQIREQFCNYFKEQQFHYRPSASLIPYDDRSLLFTNAGNNYITLSYVYINTYLTDNIIYDMI